MSETEKKTRVGVVLLNLIGALADRRRDAQQKEVDAINRLETIAEKMELEKLLLVGVSPDIIERKENGGLNMYKETTNDDSWHFSSCLAACSRLWIHTTRCKEDDQDVPDTPHLEYLGTVCCNGFITFNTSQFTKKEGKRIPYSFDSTWECIEHPERFEFDKVDNISTFYVSVRQYQTRIQIDSSVPHEESYHIQCFKRTAKKLIDYLKELAKENDIVQVITCTSNSTYTEKIGTSSVTNMLDSNQIAEACNAPVVMILNNMYEGAGLGGTSLTPKGDGFEGTIKSNDMHAYGLAKGMRIFSEYINNTKENDPKKRTLQQNIAEQ